MVWGAKATMWNRIRRISEFGLMYVWYGKMPRHLGKSHASWSNYLRSWWNGEQYQRHNEGTLVSHILAELERERRGFSREWTIV